MKMLKKWFVAILACMMCFSISTSIIQADDTTTISLGTTKTFHSEEGTYVSIQFTCPKTAIYRLRLVNVEGSTGFNDIDHNVYYSNLVESDDEKTEDRYYEFVKGITYTIDLHVNENSTCKFVINEHTGHKLYYYVSYGDTTNGFAYNYQYPKASMDCELCEDLYVERYDDKAIQVTIPKSSYEYTGSAQKPKPTVKVCGYTLKEGRDYTLSYSSGVTNVGTYEVYIKPVSNVFTIYNSDGTKKTSLTKTYKIIPKKTSITSLTAGSKKFTVKWTQITKQVSGYQIQYSTTSGFTSDNHTRTITNWKQTSTTFSNMKANKKYYVRARVYKTVSSTKYYGNYCSKKYVTTKA